MNNTNTTYTDQNTHSQEITFSLFPKNYGTSAVEQLSLEDFLQAIKNRRWKQEISEVRKSIIKYGRDSDEHKTAKKACPALTLSVSCDDRSSSLQDSEKFLGYNYIYQVDIDKLGGREAAESFRDSLSKNPHIVFAAISPSGDGVKAGLRFALPEHIESLMTDESFNTLLRPIHRAVAEEINTYLSKTYQDLHIENDKSVKDPFRICFVLDDPDLYENVNALPLELSLKDFHQDSDHSNIVHHPIVLDESLSKMDEIVRKALDKISSAVPNQRQKTTLAQSYHLGLWIGSGLLGEAGLKDKIMTAVRANPSFKTSDEHERLTAVENGLRDGILEGQRNPKVLMTSLNKNNPLTVQYTFNGKEYTYETSLAEILNIFNTLDRGEGALLEKMFQDKIRHIKERRENGWYLYDGGVWKEAKIKVGVTLAEAISSVLNPYISTLKDEITDYSLDAIERKRLREKVLGWETAKKVYIEFADSVIKDYDTHHWLLNCANGTVDLKTQEFREHRASDLLTKQLAVPYIPGTDCPQWKAFINKVYQNDQKVIQLVQTWMGLNLSGEVTEQMVFLWGDGGNGKSTIYGTFLRLLGDYGVTMPSEAFMTNNQDGGHDRIRLMSKRCAVAMEIRDNATYDSAKLKAACSQDEIVGESKYENKVAFRPTHKLTIVGNNKPRITDTSDGTRRRIIFVPHLWQIPMEDRLPPAQVEEIFTQELPGILNWCLEGWKQFCAQGHKLVIPESVKEATQDYLEEATILPEYAQFLDECDEIEVDHHQTSWTIGSKNLYEAYISWRMKSGRKGSPLSNIKFSKHIEHDGKFEKVRTNTSSFAGIRINNPEQNLSNNPSARFEANRKK